MYMFKVICTFFRKFNIELLLRYRILYIYIQNVSDLLLIIIIYYNMYYGMLCITVSLGHAVCYS